MNDDELEKRLGALRPADLPVELQTALAAPPVNEDFERRQRALEVIELAATDL